MILLRSNLYPLFLFDCPSLMLEIAIVYSILKQCWSVGYVSLFTLSFIWDVAHGPLVCLIYFYFGTLVFLIYFHLFSLSIIIYFVFKWICLNKWFKVKFLCDLMCFDNDSKKMKEKLSKRYVDAPRLKWDFFS